MKEDTSPQLPFPQVHRSDLEQARLVAQAQDLFMERGISPVNLTEVALAARLPVADIERYFPAGKPALVKAVTERYLAGFRQQLMQHGPESSNAVEELLRVRQVLQALPTEMRSLFLRELEADYYPHYQRLRTARQASIVEFMRRNLARGLAEGLYQTQLDVEQEAQQWFAQSDATVRVAINAQAMAAQLTGQLNDFLARISTPAGAYVARRLQETVPYY